MSNKNKTGSAVAGSKSVILTSVLCGVILIGVIVWAVITKSANALINQVAMTVGDKEISGVEMEYQYRDSILQFQNEYSDYISYMGVDFDKDLSTQDYSDEMSWKDYFMDSAVKTLTERYLLVNAAEDMDFTLSDEEVDSVTSDLETLKKQLQSFGISFNDYIKSIYGDEITYDLFKEYGVSNALAYNYLNEVVESFDTSDLRLNEYYSEHKDDIDTVSFRFYKFEYTVPSDTEDGDESYKDEARNQANSALDAITDEASFDSAIFAQLSSDVTKISTSGTGVSKSGIISDLSSWLFDDSRINGDKTVIDTNGGFFVLFFVGREQSDYATVNVRHILLSTEDVDKIYVDDSDEVDEEATSAAQEKADSEVYSEAEEILEKWLAGDKTEESFALLADEYSDDTSAEGGLYSQVVKDYMIDEFNDWIFDDSRVSGDYDIIKTDYGYHIMYFVGKDEIAWKLTAKKAVESEDYENYKTELETLYEVVIFEEVLDMIDG